MRSAPGGDRNQRVSRHGDARIDGQHHPKADDLGLGAVEQVDQTLRHLDPPDRSDLTERCVTQQRMADADPPGSRRELDQTLRFELGEVAPVRQPANHVDRHVACHGERMDHQAFRGAEVVDTKPEQAGEMSVRRRGRIPAIQSRTLDEGAAAQRRPQQFVDRQGQTVGGFEDAVGARRVQGSAEHRRRHLRGLHGREALQFQCRAREPTEVRNGRTDSSAA